MANATSSAQPKYYTIGEVAKICKVTKKALRLYEQLNLIVPDVIRPDNKYRYYSEETMRLVPVIKYYKQMGFKLQEMNGISSQENYFYHQTEFLSKIEELSEEEIKIHSRHQAVSDWLNMIREGMAVLNMKKPQICLKYLKEDSYYCAEQSFAGNYAEAVINIPWVNYLEEHDSEITGPVILEFPSFKEKMENASQKMTILQEPVGKINHEIPRFSYGGKMFASTYHVGDPAKIDEAYQRIIKWAAQENIVLASESFERFLIDYWASTEKQQYVIEVLIPVQNKKRIQANG